MLLGWLFIASGCDSQPNPAQITSSTSAADARPQKTYQDLIVGFAQLGAESDWRVANTTSIRETADQLGVELKFYDAQQKQENQISAVRALIVQKVDVIGISPIVETGWDGVFKEAKDAGIPIILIDRSANVPQNYYISYLGSDFEEEGRKAARVMVNITHGKANVVELQGTYDSAPANGRYKGFREILQSYPDVKIIDSKNGDFTRANGKEAMTYLLQKHGKNINAVFAQNDDMALGAIQAIEEAGLKPGVDIQIVSVDAERGAFDAMIAGKLNATIECNPLLGPQFFDLALKVANGESVPKRVFSIEGIFLPDNARDILPTRKY
jgi:simple sugar transport system substrate-binding protein